MTQLRRRLSYANVLASLSLFLALGGGAYAAGNQPAAKTGPRLTTISIATDGAGTLVARAGGVRLEMAGEHDALRVRNDTSALAHYACHGIGDDVLPTPILSRGSLLPGQTQQIVGNAQEPDLLTCRLADGETGAVTEAIIGPGTNAIYTGHVISDGAQQ
jgi:hypothetical protein